MKDTKYGNNIEVKTKIDLLLKQNARNVSNFMTKSKYDLGTEKEFKKAWRDIEKQIKALDVDFYKVIKGQND